MVLIFFLFEEKSLEERWERIYFLFTSIEFIEVWKRAKICYTFSYFFYFTFSTFKK